MHRSWSSVCLNQYISGLKTIWNKHHGEFGTKPRAHRQMSGPSDSGSGLAKNNADIIDNSVDNFDFTHDHDMIQAQECAQMLTNSVLDKIYQNGAPSQFDARTCPVHYTTSDTSKIQLLRLCSQADVPLYLFESVLKWAAASSKAGVDFSSGCQTWDKYLTALSFRYKMEQLQPIQRSTLLSDGITVMSVTCFNFLDQIQSLLDDQWLTA
jgi:hypothetical protein